MWMKLLLKIKRTPPLPRPVILISFFSILEESLSDYFGALSLFSSESFELKPEQAEWVKETTELIYKLIKETPPDGERFMASVQKLFEVGIFVLFPVFLF
jgi:hypothetical protein